MTFRLLVLVAFLVALTGCGMDPASTVSNAPRLYNGTASVGDFFTITLDPAAHTLTYTNLSNQDGGTVPYTVSGDGAYTLSDPSGNLIAAYEVPNYALILQATKTGPGHDMPALITAIEKGTISVSTWAGQRYNYMQFRTSSGGIEVGSATVDEQGSVSVSSYWPYGAMGSGSDAFHQGGFDVSQFEADPSGTFLQLSDGSNSYDYVFGTPNGIFAVDTPNGAILGLKQASSKAFDPSFAGAYKGIYYRKNAAQMVSNNMESGAPTLGKATIVVSSGGQVTIRDAQGGTMMQVAQLTPVADASYLYGSGLLQDPCYGVFTFRVTAANSQQDVFLTFMDRSVLFSSFRADLPWGSGNTYDYLYGVGLK